MGLAMPIPLYMATLLYCVGIGIRCVFVCIPKSCAIFGLYTIGPNIIHIILCMCMSVCVYLGFVLHNIGQCP